jgi:hypothetical protein
METSGGATKRIGKTTQGIGDTAEGPDQTTEVDSTTNKVEENIRTLIVSQSLKFPRDDLELKWSPGSSRLGDA